VSSLCFAFATDLGASFNTNSLIPTIEQNPRVLIPKASPEYCRLKRLNHATTVIQSPVGGSSDTRVG
jgi:hypothetical protein